MPYASVCDGCGHPYFLPLQVTVEHARVADGGQDARQDMLGFLVRVKYLEHPLCGKCGPVIEVGHTFCRVDFGPGVGLVWFPATGLEAVEQSS